MAAHKDICMLIVINRSRGLYLIYKQHYLRAVPLGVVAYISTKAEGVVNNWLLAHLHMCFNVLLCQQYVCERSCFSMVALVVYVASYSYSGTCSNNQFCCSCKYYTVQHCYGTTIDSQEMSPSGEALCELMEKHAMP